MTDNKVPTSLQEDLQVFPQHIRSEVIDQSHVDDNIDDRQATFSKTLSRAGIQVRTDESAPPLGAYFPAKTSSSGSRESRESLRGKDLESKKEVWRSRISQELGSPAMQDTTKSRGSVMQKVKSSLKRMSTAKTTKSRRDVLKQQWKSEDEDRAQAEQRKEANQTKWIHTPRAQTIFGIVIVINAVSLAVETDMHDASTKFSWNSFQAVVWLAIETCFLLTFILELSLRVQVDGLQTFKDSWNCLDLLLICTGLLDTWILQVMLAGSVSFLNASFLRVMRLLRLARIAKVFRFFRVLYLVIEGVLNAMKMVIWFVLLLVLMLFTAGIFCTIMWGRDQTYPVNSFRSVPISMFTLFQIVTMEGWPKIYDEASYGHPYSWIFFVLFIFMGNLVLLNMMTGVIVENVLQIARDAEKAQAEKEVKKRKLATSRLERVFQLLDEDASGDLCKEELTFLAEDDDAKEQLSGLNVSAEQLLKMFDKLQVGDSEFVNVDKFIDTCLRYSQGGKIERDLLSVQWDLDRHIVNTIGVAVGRIGEEICRVKKQEFKHLDSHTKRLEDQVLKVVHERQAKHSGSGAKGVLGGKTTVHRISL
eukprot:gnl/MRDRNA2_/MRDRNA2_124765_c0_seq1.p1 gnl/MRDRNA2_/MRDRNA2_124765_c0~~gnl/MRDRNA2_/MRDRNA2_124765_c0_seq1.p1  ORF type:complete len:589 (+),score=99.42 gnl/MRDRNA2_/MRDRNA2_124765_c0_seq1:150-1916(+)